MSDERPAVVVFGATGNQGSNVIKHLHAAGWADIYAVTRDVTTERAQQLPAVFPGLKMLSGDLEDKESLIAAMRGPRVPGSKRKVNVFFMSTPCLHSTGYAVDADREVLTGCSLIDAAKEAGIDHMVFSSVANCDRTGAPSYHASKHHIELKLKKSALPYTILRPVSFLEIWARLGQFSSVSISGMTKGSVRQAWVALDDVGACAALALQHNKYKHQTLDLCSDQLSGDQMAAALTQLRAATTGEKIVYKCAWFMRLFMMLFAKSIYEEKVAFQEEGGFSADCSTLQTMADTYPPEFKRHGPLTFEKFLIRYDFETKPLPAESGWGKNFVYLLAFLGAAIGLLAAVVPEEVWADIKRRWAFYGLAALFAVAVINKLLSMVRG
mmetsp:Transcript_98951/g.159544  ORF Transcript_98951/g.159544 Transcript_98951/m.159544 type:complete len:382 (+) Transcript_98951:117-1262(+)